MDAILGKNDNRFKTIMHFYKFVNTLSIKILFISNINHGGTIITYINEVNNEIRCLCQKVV